jgi:hypothetical protein
MLEKRPVFDQAGERSSLLERIAEALDCSIADLAGPTPNDLSQTVELLRLWMTIDSGQDRLKVLACIRNIAPAAAAQKRR